MLPREIVSFVFPRVSMFPSTSYRETLRLSGKQNSLFPSGAHIKCILFHNHKTRIIREFSYVVNFRDLSKNKIHELADNTFKDLGNLKTL